MCVWGGGGQEVEWWLYFSVEIVCALLGTDSSESHKGGVINCGLWEGSCMDDPILPDF